MHFILYIPFAFNSGFARTMRSLFVGKNDDKGSDLEVLNRQPQQLQELVLLAGLVLEGEAKFMVWVGRMIEGDGV